MTIEHGHANNFENDYSSVAYWYQLEPHAPFPQLLPIKQRLPRFPEAFFIAEQRIDELNQWREQLKAQIGHAAPEIVGALRSAVDRVLREDLW
ncbi:hypothetical protein ES703_118290 [subsurface metagenome]